MSTIGLKGFAIFTAILVLFSGNKPDAFTMANIEFQNVYFQLCDSVITDTKEISKEKAYEVSKKLQSEDCAQKLEKLKKLLDIMEKNQNIKDSYSFAYEVKNMEYNEINLIKESYSTWDRLSDEQIFEIVGDYGGINVMYSIGLDKRTKK